MSDGDELTVVFRRVDRYTDAAIVWIKRLHERWGPLYTVALFAHLWLWFALVAGGATLLYWVARFIWDVLL